MRNSPERIISLNDLATRYCDKMPVPELIRSKSEYLAFKRRDEVRSLKLQHPKIRVPFQLTFDISVRRGLIHRRGAAASQPRCPALGVAHLAQHHQPFAPAQHAQDAATVGVS